MDEQLILYSNVSFIIAILILLSKNKTLDAFLVLLVLSASVFYHMLELHNSKMNRTENGAEQIVGMIDVLFAVSLGIYVGYKVCHTTIEAHYIIIGFIIMIPWIASYRTDDRKKYIVYHSLWHFLVGLYACYLLCNCE